jgi:Dynein heavy chain, N-terminal region 2
MSLPLRPLRACAGLTAQEEWRSVDFEVKPYKETGTWIVGGVDEIIALLDDHIVKAQTMRGSPYIKPVEAECRAWEARLKYAQVGVGGGTYAQHRRELVPRGADGGEAPAPRGGRAEFAVSRCGRLQPVCLEQLFIVGCELTALYRYRTLPVAACRHTAAARRA